MAIIYQLKDRRVIPNWRDFKRTIQLGELGNNWESNNIIKFNIDQQIRDWNNRKNIGTASDLINSAFVSRLHENTDVEDAAQFIIDNSENSSNILNDIAKKLIEDPKREMLFSKTNSKNSLLEKKYPRLKILQI